MRNNDSLQNHGKIKQLNDIRQQLKLVLLPLKVQAPVIAHMLKNITMTAHINRIKITTCRLLTGVGQ